MNTTEFRRRIRRSLADENLQAALDANAERRVQGRVDSFASIPDWRERRQRAQTIRADVIEHLDHYLDHFVRNATENRMTVHRAKDAAEAIQLVLEIAKSIPQRRKEDPENNEETGVHPPLSASQKLLFAKSKSMVSEEINLNHALEAEGMKVVETDLGEYIVQLRNERPAHIITPAIHLRRNDVGKLFHEKLGIPYTEDIPTLTNTARKVLRDVFLTADIGISGVNFGVAETGGICLVTNEGNGRMVTSLPPVHVALMGMERLVRHFDDLALMLSLLPRSATGQKLSVYTQIVHRPLVGQQRHIILLDNGRSGLRNSPLKESLYCIRCGACLNACPVFREIGGHAYNSIYPGPIGSVISAGLFGSEFVPLAQASSLCGACKEACPVDIDLPKLLTRVRAGQSEMKEGKNQESGLTFMSKTFLRIYSHLATRPRLFAFAQRFGALGTYLLGPFSDHVRLPAVTGWGFSKDLPHFASKTFREQFSKINPRATQDRHPEEVQSQPEKKAVPEQVPALQKIDRFIEEFTKVNGQIVRVAEGEMTDKVVTFLKSRKIERIHLEPGVLDEDTLQKAGIAFSHQRDTEVRAGVTKAICGLADTGSVLEADGEGDKLFASLLPEVHVAILHESDIVPTLKNALPLARDTSSAVFITGPSRTGDIEMSHTIGVHGPGEIVVFLAA